MSVDGTLLIAAGSVFCVLSVLVGRYLATITPERLARFARPGQPVAIKEFHLLGKVMMAGGPLFLLLFSYMALSGMV